MRSISINNNLLRHKRYASSNKETPTLSRTKYCCYAVYLLNIEECTAELVQSKYESTLNKKTALLLVCLSIATTLCRSARIEVIAIYALNYLKLQVLKLTCVALFLSANIIALIGIVLYNAIKEYYDDGIRKIIYFYSYTIENKCRTSYSNKEDIEANERENKFAILAEEYIIDNRIIYALALTKDK
ncbi:hypothetical protein HBI03_245230 [Parastagonospora nodorum]|nr:hypothetical protein HBI03_245230 [Parastagonospora nodorum]KAH5526242.1 hypothetical protein HBI27_243450 [Parastagonospora nodorum]